LQITFSLLFSLIITFVSDAISRLSDKSSMISQDASFRTDFQDIVRRVDTFFFRSSPCHQRPSTTDTCKHTSVLLTS